MGKTSAQGASVSTYATHHPRRTRHLGRSRRRRYPLQLGVRRRPGAAARPVPARQGQAVDAASRVGPAGEPDTSWRLRTSSCRSTARARWKTDFEEREDLGHHLGAWLFSQFLHGEQGAMTVAARIVESVPDMDSKFYAATQTMDEARHVELYSRFLREKVGLDHPMNSDLGKLLAEVAQRSAGTSPTSACRSSSKGPARPRSRCASRPGRAARSAARGASTPSSPSAFPGR